MFKGAKHKKKESVHLSNYFVNSKTRNECDAVNNIDLLTNEEAEFKYWKSNVCFKILDIVIIGMNKRFSPRELKHWYRS